MCILNHCDKPTQGRFQLCIECQTIWDKHLPNKWTWAATIVKRSAAKKSVGFRAARARINAGSAALQGVNKGMYKLTSARKAALKKAQKLSARARKKLGK